MYDKINQNKLRSISEYRLAFTVKQLFFGYTETKEEY